MTHRTKMHLQARGALAIFSFALLLLLCPDSYLHDLHSHHDAAWFYTAGKSWWCGLRPYVDFTDSKGPLLWLIYAVGHALSPGTYVGVFWLTVAFYTVTFGALYHTARLFTGRTATAVIAAMLMSAGLLIVPVLHVATQAEDFIATFIAVTIYATCRASYCHSSTTCREAVMLGVCTGAVLLIKYNYVALQGAMVVCAAVVAWRRGMLSMRSVGLYAAGVAVVVVPIFALLAAQGCLGAMINEYFLNTARTIGNLHFAGMATSLWKHMAGTPRFIIAAPLVVAGLALAYRHLTRFRLLPIVLAGIIVAFTAFTAIYPYHMRLPGLTLLPLCIIAARALPLRGHARGWVAGIAAVCLTATIAANRSGIGTTFMGGTRQAQDEFYEDSYVMMQVPHPTIMYYRCGDGGLGLTARALPATRYWAAQVGETQAMRDAQDTAIARRVPDFVVTWNYTADSLDLQHLAHNGYVHCAVPHEWRYTVYSKHPVRVASIDSLRPSRADIILKRLPAPFHRLP